MHRWVALKQVAAPADADVFAWGGGQLQNCLIEQQLWRSTALNASLDLVQVKCFDAVSAPWQHE